MVFVKIATHTVFGSTEMRLRLPNSAKSEYVESKPEPCAPLACNSGFLKP